MIRSGAEEVILFQRRGFLAHVLANRFLQEQIPVISVETPVGAPYFGGNNYRAGLLAGEALGKHARKHWGSEFDRLVLLESSLSAMENTARLTGAVEAVKRVLGDFGPEKILHVDGSASQYPSRDACRKMLMPLPKKSRVLISCLNDPSAIGALEAVNEAGRAQQIAIVGQNGMEESSAERADRFSGVLPREIWRSTYEDGRRCRSASESTSRGVHRAFVLEPRQPEKVLPLRTLAWLSCFCVAFAIFEKSLDNLPRAALLWCL